jgi:tetratricopeptide (TPR) repeat protein
MDNRNFPAAYSQLSKVIETHPEITSAFIMRSIVLAQMGNMKAAELDLTAAEKADINLLNVPDLNQLATALNVLFKYQNAKRYADKSLSLSPTFQGYVNQGWSLWGLQQFQASIGPLTRALAIRSDFMPYLLRGKSYYMLKDYNRAESDLKNTLAIQPNQEEPYVFLGYIYQSRKNMKDACECWRKAYEIGNQADIAAEIQKFCK